MSKKEGYIGEYISHEQPEWKKVIGQRFDNVVLNKHLWNWIEHALMQQACTLVLGPCVGVFLSPEKVNGYEC